MPSVTWGPSKVAPNPRVSWGTHKGTETYITKTSFKRMVQAGKGLTSEHKNDDLPVSVCESFVKRIAAARKVEKQVDSASVKAASKAKAVQSAKSGSQVLKAKKAAADAKQNSQDLHAQFEDALRAIKRDRDRVYSGMRDYLCRVVRGLRPKWEGYDPHADFTPYVKPRRSRQSRSRTVSSLLGYGPREHVDVPAAATAELHDGMLKKRSPKNALVWQSRYFVLHEAGLLYYVDAKKRDLDNNAIKGQVLAVDIKKVVLTGNAKSMLNLDIQTSKKTYELMASTEEEASDWFKVFLFLLGEKKCERVAWPSSHRNTVVASAAEKEEALMFSSINVVINWKYVTKSGIGMKGTHGMIKHFQPRLLVLEERDQKPRLVYFKDLEDKYGDPTGSIPLTMVRSFEFQQEGSTITIWMDCVRQRTFVFAFDSSEEGQVWLQILQDAVRKLPGRAKEEHAAHNSDSEGVPLSDTKSKPESSKPEAKLENKSEPETELDSTSESMGNSVIDSEIEVDDDIDVEEEEEDI